MICNGDSREFSQHLSNCQLLSRPLGGEDYCTSSFFGATMAILWMKHDEFDLKCRELPFWVWSPPRFGSPVIVFANDDLLKASHLGDSRRRIALSLPMECCQVRQRRRQDIWEGKEMW